MKNNKRYTNMKTYKIYSLFAALMLAVSVGFTSCDEEFTDSIFDTSEEVLDRTAYTFPLDTFCKVTYQEPYNLRYLYKMQDISSNMDYNLVPISYDKAIDFAVLCKYLWFESYSKVVGDDFLKTYSPRIIHLYGSPCYNPASNTEVLGLAEGGKKITLMKGNEMNINDIDKLNEQFFKTMHHEFSHILHQNKLYPTAFNLISNGKYSPFDWQNTHDSIAVSTGFITPYGSSGVAEDWVEILANYIVKDSVTWNTMLTCASYDWETVEAAGPDTISNILGNKDLSLQLRHDLVGYITDQTGDGQGGVASYKMVRKRISRDLASDHIILDNGVNIYLGTAPKDTLYDENGEAILDKQGKPKTQERDNLGWTTRNVADGNYYDVAGHLVFVNTDGIDGYALINQKLQMVREWAKESFGYDIDALRYEVQHRQYVSDANGNLVTVAGTNGVGLPTRRYINKLTQPSEWDPSMTTIEYLRQGVLKYKELQK